MQAELEAMQQQVNGVRGDMMTLQNSVVNIEAKREDLKAVKIGKPTLGIPGSNFLL